MTEYYVSQTGGAVTRDGASRATAWAVADLSAAVWNSIRGATNILHVDGLLTSRLYIIPSTPGSSWADRILVSGLAYNGRVVNASGTACQLDGGLGANYVQIEDLYLSSTVASTGRGMACNGTPAAGENRFYRLTIEDCTQNGIRIAKNDLTTMCAFDIRDCTVRRIGTDCMFIQEYNGLTLVGNYCEKPSTITDGGDACQISAASSAGNVLIAGNTFKNDSTSTVKQGLMVVAAAGQHIVIRDNYVLGASGGMNVSGINGGTFDVRSNLITCEQNQGDATQFIVRLSDWADAGSKFCGNVLLGGNLKNNGLQLRAEEGPTSQGLVANNTVIGAKICSLNISKAVTFTIKNNVFYSEVATYALDQGGANWNTGITMDRNCYYGGTWRYAPGGVVTSLSTLAAWVASASEDANSVNVNPALGPDYSVTSAIEELGEWLAGVMLYDGLPQPLRPPMGAVARRDLAAQRHRRQALRRALGTESIRI